MEEKRRWGKESVDNPSCILLKGKENDSSCKCSALHLGVGGQRVHRVALVWGWNSLAQPQDGTGWHSLCKSQYLALQLGSVSLAPALQGDGVGDLSVVAIPKEQCSLPTDMIWCSSKVDGIWI